MTSGGYVGLSLGVLLSQHHQVVAVDIVQASLYYERIASVPLSASLTKEQEENVRKLLKLDPAEVLIMFIGIGNYPDECQTTRSERKPAEYTVI